MRTFAEKPKATLETSPAAAAMHRAGHFKLSRIPSSPSGSRAVREVLASPGRALDPETRSLMESRLGHDFSHVRIHADSQAASSARTINAIAYTVGQDVVLPEAAESVAGSRSLAHELTHVVQ